MTPQLLVSVRSVAEAEEALAGGADLIDVKEPSLGSLGRASDAVVAEVVKCVAGRVPTSAALGELAEWDGTMPGGVDFVKVGLAGMGGGDWRGRLDAFRGAADGRAVIVAYADWRSAGAPSLEDVVHYAERISRPILLIDTHGKNGSTLFDLVDEPTLARCIARIRLVEGRIALAGSLSRSAAKSCASLEPDWIAVRGAVCDGGRSGTVRGQLVREFKRQIAGPIGAPPALTA
jgi:(5-formylfuran-3-yl)methyl phosphate synthase